MPKIVSLHLIWLLCCQATCLKKAMTSLQEAQRKVLKLRQFSEAGFSGRARDAQIGFVWGNSSSLLERKTSHQGVTRNADFSRAKGKKNCALDWKKTIRIWMKQQRGELATQFCIFAKNKQLRSNFFGMRKPLVN